nr:immunoglobulin heavy chain junction region [Macaca mulatta]MOW75628.1 immunoglobulin heavy chain junction region [Macaca mulatta]MOW75964.1 immunoglobulin heavy chain junction region [Macaca mulatta]MOW76717.1 immunoglobulin heavy chain junction region [Macaca mulatta]MOW77267.1 immunoglobulin heavy chain junction region [Macaca mulatta]
CARLRGAAAGFFDSW